MGATLISNRHKQKEGVDIGGGLLGKMHIFTRKQGDEEEQRVKQLNIIRDVYETAMNIGKERRHFHIFHIFIHQ